MLILPTECSFLSSDYTDTKQAYFSRQQREFKHEI